MIYSGIYCIENLINGKKYIGQSVNIEARWKKHKSELNDNKHFNDYLQKSWNKYGPECFKFSVVELCDACKLDDRESYYIGLYNTLDRDCGYNLVSGGSFGRKYSQEVCNKISMALIGHEVAEETRLKIRTNHADVSGANNGMYGKHHTEEAKRKVGDANRGRKSARRNCNEVYCIDLDKVFVDATDAAKILNLDSSGILKCCKGERKTCGGYQWEFVNLENNKS